MERSLSAIGSTGAVWPLYDLSLSLSVSVQVSLQLHSPVAPVKKKKKKAALQWRHFQIPRLEMGSYTLTLDYIWTQPHTSSQMPAFSVAICVIMSRTSLPALPWTEKHAMNNSWSVFHVRTETSLLRWRGGKKKKADGWINMQFRINLEKKPKTALWCN